MKYFFSLALLTFALPCGAGELAPPDAVRRSLRRIESSREDEWRDELRLDELKAATSSPTQTDLELLRHVLQRFTMLRAEEKTLRDEADLVSLRQAVEEWLATESLPAGTGLTAVASSILHHAPAEATCGMNVPRGPKEPRAYPHRQVGSRQWLRRRLISLIGSLARYQETADPEIAGSIGRQLNALAACRHAAPIVAAVRRYYSHPNVWIDVSEDLLDDCIEGDIDRWDAIDTVVLGTPVSGKGRVQGLRALVIEAGTDGAVLKIVVEGTIDSNTVAHRNSVRIESHSLTTFRAEKPVLLGASGLRVLPTVCEAQTQTLGSQVSTSKAGLRGQILRRIAQRRSKSLRDAADQESSQHAQDRVLKAIDREADILVKRVSRLAVLPLMVLGGGSGNRLQVVGEKRVLRVGTIVGALGAPPGRPPCDEHQLVTIRVHQSLARPVSRRAIADLVSTKLEELPSVFTFVGLTNDDHDRTRQGDPLQGFLALFRQFSPHTLSSWRPTSLAWRLLERTVAPKLTGRGVMLRDGKWGTILPVQTSGDWLAAEWRPAAAGHHMAQAVKSPAR